MKHADGLGSMTAVACLALDGLFVARTSQEPEAKKEARARRNEHAPDVFEVNLDTSKGPS